MEFETIAVDKNDPLFDLAPSAATLKFKKEKFAIEMSVMGFFSMSIIGDSKTKTLAQTVKFMNIKQACIETQKELQAENLNYPLKFEETSETKEIVGLKCHKVKVTKLAAPYGSFDIWYTKELGMADCNNLTVYAPIKGVLIDYQIRKMGLELHFIAKSYKPEEVPDNTFEIPASMKIVSKEEMAKVFEGL